MTKTTIGIQITEASVRAIELAHGSSPRVVAHGIQPLPEGAAKDSEVLDHDAVVLALRRLWDHAGIRGHSAILGIGGRRVLVREHTMPATLNRTQLRNALAFQVDDLLPVSGQDAVSDFYPVSNDGQEQSGLLVATYASKVQALIDALRAADVTTTQVDLSGFALIRAASRLIDDAETVAVIGIGFHTTTLSIIAQGIPRLVRIIASELEGIDQADSAPAAPEPDTEVRRRAGRRVGADVSNLAVRLRSTATFYYSRPDATPINRVLLTGPATVRADVCDMVAREMNGETIVFTVKDLVSGVSNMSMEESLALVPPFGLALYGGAK